MTIHVRLNNKEQLQSYLGQNDYEYAEFLFNKYEEPGDILASVTPEQYEKLCADSRYRIACQQAAKKLALGLAA